MGAQPVRPSGHSASQAVAESQPADTLGQRVNEGLGEGFAIGWPLAVLVFIIGAWT